MFRLAIVVDTHPEDHSVDLVMLDDGSRVVGAQVMAQGASGRTGTVDMPEVPKRSDKWDITERDDQDQVAVVGFVGRNPVVTGFLYPQVSQMTFKDPKMRFTRHQSDVSWGIDGDGNIQLDHPSGTYIRIGEAPDRVDMAGKNADESLRPDRNTGRKVNIRIGLAGGVLELTMTPEGAVSLKCDSTINVEAKGSVTVKTEGSAMVEAAGDMTLKSPAVTVDTPLATFTGDIKTSAIASVNRHVHVGVRSGPDRTGVPAG